MDLRPAPTAAQVAALIGARVVGDPEQPVHGINEINRVRPGDLVFVDHPKYYEKALNSPATIILIDKDDLAVPAGKVLLVSPSPCADYNRLVTHYMPGNSWEGSARIGEGSRIHPSAVLGENVRIGKDCIIHPGVVVYANTSIGDRCIIHANTVIGADSFYYKKTAAGYDKMVTGGTVVLEDDVEIGALCTIDRGLSADTRIGAGTKIDNHVQVGHDTLIGQRCLIAAHVGIAGCCVIEDEVTLWGQVGVPSKITIGKGAVVLGQSGLINSLPGGRTYFGSPADEVKRKYRELALVRKLPAVMDKLGL